jgi:class 3 adenylate cyclase
VAEGGIRYARNGDVSIAYTVIGEGELDLIFVGGFVGHLEIVPELPASREFWERLGSFAKVICFDKRGMGLSDRDVGEYTVEGIAEDMRAVLDAAGCERAAVFGVSEGGSAATYFAATQPDRVSSLVEYGTYARLARTADNPSGVPAELILSTTERMAAAWGDDPHLEWWAPSWKDDLEAQRWWGRLLRAGTSPGAIARVQELYLKLDVTALLGAVGVPALILWRRDDRLVPAALSRAVAEGIPGARGVELPGADHLFLAGDQAALLGEVEEFLTGSRRAEQPTRALATVLFTDIVGSTERAAQVGDARWRELLAEHDRIARRAVARERGSVVKSTGDGILATFDGPGRAIAAAREMRAAVQAPGLEIRAGIHTGECERLGPDLGGIAVHIGARVSAAAAAGEVLVSQTVRDLVVGSELELEDRGAHALKGIPGEWRLFAVAG